MEEATFDPLSDLMGGEAPAARAQASAPVVRVAATAVAETLAMPDIGKVAPPSAPEPAPKPNVKMGGTSGPGTFSRGLEGFSSGLPASSADALDSVLGGLSAEVAADNADGGLFGTESPAPAPAASSLFGAPSAADTAGLFGSAPAPAPAAAVAPSARVPAGSSLLAQVETEDDGADSKLDDLLVGRILEREDAAEGGKNWLAQRVQEDKSALDPALANDGLLSDAGDALLGQLEAATITAPVRAPVAAPALATATAAVPAATGAALDDDLFSYVGANSGGGAADASGGGFNMDDYIAQNASSGGGGGLFD